MNFNDEKSLIDYATTDLSLNKLKLDLRVNRLLAVGFCHNVWRRFNKRKDHRHKEIVEFLESYADGNGEEKERDSLYSSACSNSNNIPSYCALCSVCANILTDYPLHWVRIYLKNESNEQQIINEVKLIVSAVGPGFQFDNEWKNDTVVPLAKTIYSSKDWTLMPILADALQDAGCDKENILNHLRSRESKFCRGCWILDKILEKR